MVAEPWAAAQEWPRRRARFLPAAPASENAMNPRPLPVPRTCAVIGLALLAVACGGGSDAPAPAPAPPSAPVALQISTANQDAVARAAANIVVNAAVTGAVAPLADGERVTAATAKRTGGAAPSLAGTTSATGALQRFVEYALARRGGTAVAAGDTVRVLAVLRQTEACAISGNVTITIDDADNSGSVSAGDSVGFSFNACRSGLGETIDGGLTLRVATVSGPNATGTLTFTELAAATLEASFAITGSVDLAYTEAGTLATYRTAVGAGGLTTLVTAPPFSDAITLRAGFEQVVTSDSAAIAPGSMVRGLNTARVAGSIGATSLGGEVTLSTPATFERYAIDSYPRSGQLLAVGAGGSRVRVTALSVTTVRVELDANGDGTYEQSRELPWGALI
jgi:hypothetical protein